MNHLKSKNIILWRHADAEIVQLGQDDIARKLTEKGCKQAAVMQRWMKKHVPKQTRVFVSPAVRAMQTAKALPQQSQSVYALRPDAKVTEVLAFLDEEVSAESILIVGHQPWLGRLVGELLNMQDATFSIKKGAVWWLRLGSREVSQYQIYSVQTPQLL